MVKPRSKQKSQASKNLEDTTAKDIEIEQLAESLADKPYGAPAMPSDISNSKSPEKLERVTITMPTSTRIQLEDMAMARRRAGEPNKSVSAIIREALESYL